MNITQIALLVIASVIVLVLLKNAGSPSAVIVRLAVVAVVFIGVLPQIKELISLLDGFDFAENIPKEALKIMIKIFSVLTLSSIAGDICRDNGEGSLAGIVELSGKLISIGLCIPILNAVVTVAISFFQSG